LNVGSQIVTIIYNAQALSRTVNTRHQSIRERGIYSGGYLGIVDSSNCSISSLICEISDGTYQVKVQTQATVNLAVAEATPYVVLRWVYTGSAANDYMAFLAVASPATNDIVVGKCSFTGGGALQGFIYSERTTPSVHELFLRVEETATSELRVRIRAGRIQNGKETIQIPDQLSDLFTAPSANSKVYLVYVNRATGAIAIDSTGTEAASPVAPNYAGKLVLAEVTLASTAVNILQSNIVDVRDFINMFYSIDETTMRITTAGAVGIKTGVLGQSDIVTAINQISPGTTIADVPNMVINMTTSGGNVQIDFCAPVSTEDGREIILYMNVDGVNVASVRTDQDTSGQSFDMDVVSFPWLVKSLAAGPHTFKIRWRIQSGIGYMNRHGNTNRILRVVELPHTI
jgi:hypothetical protein